jgi:GntR family transcriptional regulator
VDIVLNRRGGIPVRDQLVAQLELKILGGAIPHGQRLPSVRALARRLKVHHNTVSAAYQDLQAAGRVELRRGSGVYVRGSGPTALTEARGLDEMIRLALHTAFAKGFTGGQVRMAVERWLAAAPPDRVVVVDPALEMAELLVHEVRQSLGVAAQPATPADVERDPRLLSGALVLVLPYHVEAIRRLSPAAAVEVVTIEAKAETRALVMGLPAGSIVLVVSHSPTVLPFASVFLRSLRGDELVVETHTLAAARAWRRVVKAADLVAADALSADAVRRAGARRLHEMRLLSPAVEARLRHGLSVVVPRSEGTARAPAAGRPGPAARETVPGRPARTRKR